ncbi:MAG: DUF885 domain-containing protein [Halieaceae bacterium]|jgi:uncharacterized protein (DUF885 family)|nr:DUF885 domain-containing protein [Halieaceae bacterium]
MKIQQILVGTALIFAMARSVFATDNSALLQQLLDEHWANANREQIFFRKDPDTFRMNGKLPDVSEAGRERRAEFNLKVLEKLRAIGLEGLSEGEQVSYRLFRYERESEAESYGQIDHLYPMNYYNNYASYFAGAPANMSFLGTEDYEKYMVSLADFPRYNAEHIYNLEQAIASGHTHYCKSFENYERRISKHLVERVEDSVFYTPLAAMPDRIAAADQRRFLARGTELIDRVVIPEFRKFYIFFTEQYMPNCRREVGITSVKGGDAYYRYLVRFYTTTDMTPKQIHDLGLSEVKRIRREMNSIIEQVKFEGEFKAFIKFLRSDPAFYAETSLDLMEKASYVTRKMAAQLPKWFSLLPRSTFDIKASPDGGAYYVAPDGSGATAGTYFLDVADLRAMPLYTLEALTFHEAEPGHHFQGSIAMELDVPEFRKTLYHSAYGEGWGLYAERLGKEMGFYRDPYSDFGRLTYEMWRACRLVVDTGMHVFGWSRQKAMNYLAANTALSMADVAGEIDRYITWPAQALSYKIGELKIRELRARAESTLGENFNIRDFHDHIVKNGSLPMEILEDLTNLWIEEHKSLH